MSTVASYDPSYNPFTAGPGTSYNPDFDPNNPFTATVTTKVQTATVDWADRYLTSDLSVSTNYAKQHADLISLRDGEAGWKKQEADKIKALDNQIKGLTKKADDANLAFINSTQSLSSPLAEEARELSKKLMKAEPLKDAALNFFADGSAANKDALNQALQNFSNSLGDSFNKEFIFSELKKIGFELKDGKLIFPEGALSRANAGKLLELFKESRQGINFAKEALRLPNQPNKKAIHEAALRKIAAEDGALMRGPAAFYETILRQVRKIPLAGDALANIFGGFGKSEVSEVRRAANIAMVNHGNKAAKELLSDFTFKTMKNNVKNGGLDVLKDALLGGLKGTKIAFKPILGKIAAITAPIMAFTGIAKMDNAFGWAAKKWLDFAYTDGAGENAANGDYGKLAVNMVEHAGLTAVTGLAGVAGLTGALTASLGAGLAAVGITCPPLLLAIGAGSLIYGGANLLYSGGKNIIAGLGSSKGNDSVANNNGSAPIASAPAAPSPDQVKTAIGSLDGEAKKTLEKAESLLGGGSLGLG